MKTRILSLIPMAVAAVLAESPAARADSPQDTAAAGIELEEVVVTAQRRQESAQEVPISIAVFSSDNLQALNVADARDLAAVTPGLQIKGGWVYSTPTVFLRGVGDNNFNTNNVSAVGFYFDEVYVGSSVGLNQLMLDMDRVEVLKGPQGTLYGRNTTGGAINFITTKPKIGDPLGGSAEVTVGSYGLKSANAALQLPISDVLAARVAVTGIENDGPFRNSITGDRGPGLSSYATRAILRYVPSDAVDVQLVAHGGRNSAGVVDKSLGALDPETFGPCAAVRLGGNCVDYAGYQPSGDILDLTEGTRSSDKVTTYGAALHANVRLSDLTLTSITAYEKNRRVLREDLDHLPSDWVLNDWTSSTWQASQEFRLASPYEAQLSWTAGLYFFREKLDSFSSYALRGFGPGIISGVGTTLEGVGQQTNQTTTSYAAFGEGYYHISDALTLTLGARWTSEQKRFLLNSDLLDLDGTTPATYVTAAYSRANALARLVFQDADKSWRQISGRAALDYRFTSDVMGYLSIARGFKAGGYNGGALASQSDVAVVDPEKLTAYEVGIKSMWLDGRLRFNAAAFLYDYADQQVFVVRSDGPIIVLSLENAAKSRITGADFELEARPARPLLLTLSGSYLDASVTSFAAGQGVVSYKGNTLPSAPRWHLNGMARYTIPLGRSFSLSLQADARYVSKVFFDLSNNPLLTQGGNTIVNARVTLESDQSTWSLALWGKNLNDKKYFVDGFDNSAYGYYGFPVGEPRAYGLTLTKKF